ncbi:ABC transporter ATP-binding protein [Akkermansia sp. N21169]|jgi:subfamily B ATP-binding cassette protein MsbA|uniref:ABC transporter ATP-binding protein n=1 Tax=Akkermansia sp. N21169 TaxID=3040765 RepID=UPI00244ED696|nr:ABC transporter ATP-binding protein [Akkermansia sp. N21169]MDH3067547.1 ABC transporter ATP-binding protein [Akkermansia sp. N21169]
MMKQFFRFLVYLKPLLLPFILALLSGVVASAASGFGIPMMIDKVFPVVFDNSKLPPFIQDILVEMVAPDRLHMVVLITACLILPLVMTIRGVATFINGYLTAFVGMRVLEEIRMKAFSHLQMLPLSFHESQKKGDLISRLLTDTQNVQAGITQVSNDLIKQPMTLVSALCFLGYQAAKTSQTSVLLSNLFFVSLSIWPIYFFGKRMVEKARRAQKELGDIMAVAQENLCSQREVRSYGMQGQQVAIFRQLTERFIRIQMKAVKYKQFLVPVLEGVCALGLGYLLVRCNSVGMKESDFMSFATALFMCYDPIKRLGMTYNRLKQAQASLERLNFILDQPDNMPDPENPVPLGKVKGNVSFRDVSFSYDGKHKVLEHINVDVPAGQVVALVGPSGAGKTTFASLIPRFYEVSSGSVHMDGVDLRDATKADVRSNISLVSQSPFIFRNSIIENIRLGKPGASDEEVIESAKKASVHDFAQQKEQGYYTMLADYGDGLSGGQKQRVAIARAFLKDAPILILDEATASLDSESENKIQEELDKLVVGRTTFIVAHRFSSIRIAQRILVFESGRIIADGTHDDLYVSCPLYKELYDKQSI